jgi:hypothetical protein
MEAPAPCELAYQSQKTVHLDSSKLLTSNCETAYRQNYGGRQTRFETTLPLTKAWSKSKGINVFRSGTYLEGIREYAEPRWILSYVSGLWCIVTAARTPPSLVTIIPSFERN